MRVVLAGASGLIGSALKDELAAAGHDMASLVRRATSSPLEKAWDPAAGTVDHRFLADADAVVCLSGVGVADRRWTDAYKRKIVSSRVEPVRTLAQALADGAGPRTLVCASAVGYYGDTGDREVDEQAPAGDSFLADVCVQWERAAQPAVDAGVRVVHLRTGLVLAKGAGLLKPLTLVVKAGIGGKLGSGRQYMPWITLRDEVRAIRYAVENDVRGPLNLTAPRPATNADFTRALGSVLHRPTVLPVPGFAARIALGEFAGEVLGGQRAIPRALTEHGFEFADTDLDSALRKVLG